MSAHERYEAVELKGHRARRSLAVVIGLGLLAAPLSSVSVAQPVPCTAAWTSAALPSVVEGELFDVDAHSADSAWAVGEQYDETGRLRSLALRWDGTEWTGSLLPTDPTHLDRLSGVAAIGADDAWAVGVDIHAAVPDRTLIARWQDGGWVRVPSPNAGPPPDDNGTLLGVTAIGPDHAWAVGSFRDPAPQPLALHWNGAAWAVVETPAHPEAEAGWLSAVAASGPDDVWAVGGYISQVDSSWKPLIMHGDGTSWTIVDAPAHPAGDNNLLDVIALDVDDAWAVGHSGNRAVRLRWDGTAWTHAPGTAAGFAAYAGIDGASSHQLWTAGSGIDVTAGLQRSLIERFDGRRWTGAAVAPVSDEDYLSGVAAVPLHGWAVGSYLAPGEDPEAAIVQPLLLHRCGFVDVAGTAHEASIAAVAAAGITDGYPDGTFRPNLPTTRGQMATMLARALDLEAGDASVFTDVVGTTHEAGIGAVAAAGIAAGYPDGTFRPGAPTTRGQMATMLARALDLEAGDASVFTDVVGTTHEAGIGAVAAAGIAAGYPDGTFRPGAPTTRGQMATMLTRGLVLPPA